MYKTTVPTIPNNIKVYARKGPVCSNMPSPYVHIYHENVDLKQVTPILPRIALLNNERYIQSALPIKGFIDVSLQASTSVYRA